MQQFRIEETISESSTTRVYRAFQVTLARRVLLKVLRPHLATDPAIRERFEREAHTCARLRSEHIVQVYDLTVFENSPAIVMEYVNGRSLKELMLQAPDNRLELARKTAIQVLQGLAVAHRNGITHRDIKPGNILITEDEVLKLTDFGLAHLTDSTLATADGVVVGTPAYMAPEQIRGDRIDGRTDLFSLGATLVEILSGERIFEGQTHAECIRKVLAFKPEELDRFVHLAPEEFLGFLKRLMHQEPGMRFESAQEALVALHAEPERLARHGFVPGGFRESKYLFRFLGAVLMIAALTALITLRPGIETAPGTSDGIVAPPDTSTRSLEEKNDLVKQPFTNNRSDFKAAPGESVGGRLKLPVVPAAAALDTPRVRFTCNPWGKVFVDGQLVGETPLAGSFALAVGKHAITFSNPLFEPIVKQVNLRSGTELTVSADFMDGAGFLMCNVQPWAEVYVDEVYRDTTPLKKPIVLSAGRHRVRFHNPSTADVTRDITVAMRDTLRLTISLQ